MRFRPDLNKLTSMANMGLVDLVLISSINQSSWMEAIRNHKTTLDYQDWKGEQTEDIMRKSVERHQRRLQLGIEKRDIKRNSLERGRGRTNQEDLGILPEEEVLFARERELKERLANSSPVPKVMQGESREVALKEHVERWKKDRLHLEVDWSNLYAKVRDDFFAEKCKKIEVANTDRPYRLVRHAADPLAQYPNSSGVWSATSTKWGKKIHDGTVNAFSEFDPSKNAALVFLFNTIEREDKGKALLPFNPMDADC
jgi:hypothetical protein